MRPASRPVRAGVWPGVMRFRANLREAGSSLAATGVRSTLALIGIAVGIGAVIAMVSIGEIVKAESLRQFRALGTDVVTIRRAHRDPVHQLARTDVTSLPEAVSLIGAAAPWTSDYAEFVYAGTPVGRGQVLGVTASFAALHRLAIVDGRFISDLDRDRAFCVLGSEIGRAVRAAGARQTVGAAVRIHERLCTVVGVLGANPSSAQSAGTDDAVLLPIGMTTRLGQQIGQAIARLRPGADAAAAVRQVTAHFRRVAPHIELKVVSARHLIAQMQRQARMFTLVFGAIGSIALLVGGIGVMNVMLMAVTERRTEIGLRRALGARRGDVVAQFLTESAVLCLIGGAAGIVLGAAGAWGISRFAGWSFFVSETAVLVGVGVSTAVGVFFGLYPARQAARLDPIAALRA